MSKAAVIVGGHGNVRPRTLPSPYHPFRVANLNPQIALRLARLLSPKHSVTSIIRDPSHASDISATGATPLVLSLENDSVSTFTNAFTSAQADVVYFAAGAGGKGGVERTRKVDYEGAVKVFDAIEGVGADGNGNGGNLKKPHLVLVSAIDVRDLSKVPEHYVSIVVGLRVARLA